MKPLRPIKNISFVSLRLSFIIGYTYLEINDTIASITLRDDLKAHHVKMLSKEETSQKGTHGLIQAGLFGLFL